MKLWIDGDACPRAVREIVFRAAERLRIEAIVVANREARVPRSRYIRAIRVPKGFDVADRRIVEQVEAGDVVITQDIPLAAELVPKRVHVISPHGETFTEENVGERLAMRDLLQGLRDQGAILGGPAPFGEADKRNLASALDRILTKARINPS